MKIRPIGKRVLVKPIAIEEKTTTGILLIQNNEEKNYRIGQIIALSDDDEVLTTFKLKDHVIFSKKTGIKIERFGENFILLELEEILGIIED
ncbi:co-chaperone GroES [uncultured Cetobacterium sp.]|uniref:co-chaperone GroES n=1 Tax=uncultured Cetobacterium sp. TaxID=527638 RepID=UPI00263843DA|nr:co-chaperone GroES [uncultured Cetobacterium sp.]